MSNFFDFLLALITFQWLGDRSQSVGSYDNWLVLLGPKGECVSCEADVYFDTDALKWKHLATRKIMGKTPHGQPHEAIPWLGWAAIEAAEKADAEAAKDPDMVITTVGMGPKPITTAEETEVATALRALDYSVTEARDAARAVIADPTVGSSLEERVLAVLRKRAH